MCRLLTRSLTVLLPALALGGACTTQPDGVPSDAGSDGGIGCQQRLTCTPSDPFCTMDWPADVTAFCAVNVPLDESTLIAEVCGGYHLMIALNIDSSTYFYYSSATGKLVAIVGFRSWDPSPRSCVAGPPDFVEPTCLSDPTDVNCTDAGAGGSGAGGAAGASGAAGNGGSAGTAGAGGAH